MTYFNKTRFVDIGQELYVHWLKTVNNADKASEEERRKIFNFAATLAFEATEEFAKVFANQEL